MILLNQGRFLGNAFVENWLFDNNKKNKKIRIKAT